MRSLDTSHKSPWVVISRCLLTSLYWRDEEKVDLTIGAHHKSPKDYYNYAIDCVGLKPIFIFLLQSQHLCPISVEFDGYIDGHCPHPRDNWISGGNLSLLRLYSILQPCLLQKIKFLFYVYVFYLSTPSFFIRVTNSRVNMKKKVAS